MASKLDQLLSSPQILGSAREAGRGESEEGVAAYLRRQYPGFASQTYTAAARRLSDAGIAGTLMTSGDMSYRPEGIDVPRMPGLTQRYRYVVEVEIPDAPLSMPGGQFVVIDSPDPLSGQEVITEAISRVYEVFARDSIGGTDHLDSVAERTEYVILAAMRQ